MLNVSRKIGYFQNLKHFSISHRVIYSGRVPRFLSNTVFKDASSSGSKKEGYGEKEIYLLGPADVRTPLPGNTGIPPISMLYTVKLKQLPKPAGEKCDVISSQLPEERYHNLLTQAACVATEEAVSSQYKLECVVHSCPHLLKKDFLDLFPNRDLSHDTLTVITLCQKTENDMRAWSEASQLERENLEKFFVIAAKEICTYLKEFSYWADFIHPNSGKPHLSSLTNSTMFETDLRYRNFGFDIEDLGCCKVISHHRWGTHIYVGAIFTNAFIDSAEVQDIINKPKSKISNFSYSD